MNVAGHVEKPDGWVIYIKLNFMKCRKFPGFDIHAQP